MFDTRKVENFILKRGAKRKRILDVGCGDCGLLIKLAERNRLSELWCVDTYIERAAKNINRRGFSQRIKCVRAKAENIPLESHFFDFIYSFRSLHEFYSPARALKEIRRLLASKGELIIADWKKGAKTGVFERYYGKEELLKFLESAGYDLQYVKLKEIGRFNIILYSEKSFQRNFAKALSASFSPSFLRISDVGMPFSSQPTAS
jgi:ubiquinone/menaquinone biosynthesis C-methylase UbiE